MIGLYRDCDGRVCISADESSLSAEEKLAIIEDTREALRDAIDDVAERHIVTMFGCEMEDEMRHEAFMFARSQIRALAISDIRELLG